MIRIDSIWLATEPVDMGVGTETAVAIQALIKSPIYLGLDTGTLASGSFW